MRAACWSGSPCGVGRAGRRRIGRGLGLPDQLGDGVGIVGLLRLGRFVGLGLLQELGDRVGLELVRRRLLGLDRRRRRVLGDRFGRRRRRRGLGRRKGRRLVGRLELGRRRGGRRGGRRFDRGLARRRLGGRLLDRLGVALALHDLVELRRRDHVDRDGFARVLELGRGGETEDDERQQRGVERARNVEPRFRRLVAHPDPRLTVCPAR